MADVQATCPGDCCTSFPLSLDAETPAAQLAIIKQNGDGWDHQHKTGYWVETARGPFAADKAKEWTTLRDMIIVVGEKEDGRGLFSCRHFDAETRRCGIYDRRPIMCSSYPNGYSCQYCSFDEAQPDVAGKRWASTAESGIDAAFALFEV